MPITILPAEVEDLIASGLLARLDADLLARYPGEPVNGVDPAELRAAGGYSVIASCDAQTAGAELFDRTTPGRWKSSGCTWSRAFVGWAWRGRS